MKTKLSLFVILSVFSFNVHAEYYLVYPTCQHCNVKTVKVKRVVHHIKHKSSCPTRRVHYVRHPQRVCHTEYCVNGQYVDERDAGGKGFRPFPYARVKHHKWNYDDYNADMATGDDDTFRNPDMLIN